MPWGDGMGIVNSFWGLRIMGSCDKVPVPGLRGVPIRGTRPVPNHGWR